MKRKQKKTTSRMFEYQFIKLHLIILWQQITVTFMLTLRLKSLLRKKTSSLRNTSKPVEKKIKKEKENENKKEKEKRRKKRRKRRRRKRRRRWRRRRRSRRKSRQRRRRSRKGRRKMRWERRRSFKSYYDILHAFLLNQNIFELSDII
jgi:hypothetical protein